MNIQKLIRPNIRKLAPYICARHNRATGIKLDANENPYGNVNRYPDPNATEVKKILAKMLDIKAEDIFVGNGSDEAIDLLMRAFCDPGEEIIVLDPTYRMYKVAAGINDLKVKSVPLTKDFQINVEKTLSSISKKTKIIFTCSPNNPTGNLLKKKDIFELCKNFKGIVAVDEAYIEFANEKSCISNSGQYPNLVVLRTLSKAWGGAGIRVGYATGSPEIIKALNKIKPPYNVSVLDQKEAVKILSSKTKIKKILRERNRVSKELKELVSKVCKSDANFILFEIPNAKHIQEKLQSAGVIIRNTQIKNCLRVSIGKSGENDKFLRALSNLLKS